MCSSDPGASSSGADVALEWPRTRAERLRMATYHDLHRRGYCLTSGAKFGAEYLAYPGDPSLFHAQFTVRTVEWEDTLHPLALAAAARMSHAARKHVLLAAVTNWPHEQAEPPAELVVEYLTVGPDVALSSQRATRREVAA